LPGIRLEPLSPAIAVASTRLPWEVHPDPADRILLATARDLDREQLQRCYDEAVVWAEAALHFS